MASPRLAAPFLVTLSSSIACTPAQPLPGNPPHPTTTINAPIASATAAAPTAPTVASSSAAPSAGSPSTRGSAAATTALPEPDVAKPKVAKWLNPVDHAKRWIRLGTNRCFVERPDIPYPSGHRPPAPPTQTVTCPPAMKDPAYENCRAGVIPKMSDGTCRCMRPGNPPRVLPGTIPCPAAVADPTTP